MEAPFRAVVAHIAGLLITGNQTWAIQDNDRHRPVYIDGSVGASGIRVYSHELHTYVSGMGNGAQYLLFEHHSAVKVSLEVNIAEQRFAGCDQSGPCHFFGDVSGGAVRLFDFQDLQWHSYTL